MIIFDFLFLLCWNFWFVIWITHVQACSYHKVLSHHFWSCNTISLWDRKKVREAWSIYLQSQATWKSFIKKISKKISWKAQKFYCINITYNFFWKIFIHLSLQLSLLFLFLKKFHHLLSKQFLLSVIIVYLCCYYIIIVCHIVLIITHCLFIHYQSAQQIITVESFIS